MEIVAAEENPALTDLGMQIVGLGGGATIGVAILEAANNELTARGLAKWATALLDFVIAGGIFAAAAGHSGLGRNLLLGAGTAASVETISTAIETLQGV